MPRIETLSEKLLAVLYKNPDEVEVHFSDHELELKKMYEDVFAKWLENPIQDDKDMVQYIENEYKRSKTQAYRDIATIKRVLGNITNASKEWHRYTVIETIKYALQLAKNKNDYIGILIAIDKLGKYTKLDKEESEEIPWRDIIPPSFEPTGDITVLGLKAIPNLAQRRKQLERKYLSKSLKISDVEIVEDDE